MNQKKYEQTLTQMVIDQMKFDFNQHENFDENEYGDQLANLKQMLQNMIKGNEKNLIAYVSTEYPEEFKRDMKSRNDWYVEGVLKN